MTVNIDQKEIEKIMFERINVRNIEFCKKLSKTMTAQEILDNIGNV